ncbi:MAG: DUF3142 domain-containing protein [Alphaproteobacteria bacterium]|nr:DUF3142 domain-containing protein [Alphaproteobacteria bacterium]
MSHHSCSGSNVLSHPRRGLYGVAAFFFIVLVMWPLFKEFAVFQDEGRSYWLWAGITEMDLPAGSVDALYIYQGVIENRSGEVRYSRHGLFPFPLRKGKKVYLVFRQEGDWPEARAMAALYEETASAWRRHAVNVRGLQIDADVPTSKLEAYGRYIEALRAALPQTEGLSVTGLCDWIVRGDPAALRRLATVADGIVFQFYRGRRPLADEAFYANALKKANYPFQIGLLEKGGISNAVAGLKTNPYYKGVVFFIQKEGAP